MYSDVHFEDVVKILIILAVISYLMVYFLCSKLTNAFSSVVLKARI